MQQRAADLPVSNEDSANVLDPDRAGDRIAALIENVETVFLGKPKVVRLAVTSLLAGGHVLLEDVPGVGKTTLAQALAASIGAEFTRIQFTSDLLPADILGVTVYNRDRSEFEFKKGPLFANLVLADEINRTTPRTQSALLEAMAEGRVSVDESSRTLPYPFVVVATQNPLEYHGTYPLPESQLDRFLVRMSIGYPGKTIERSLLLSRGDTEPVDELKPVLSLEEFTSLVGQVPKIRLDESLVDWMLEVVEATRRSPDLRTGVSTRGALALASAARARALVHHRAFVVPDDLLALFTPVLAHRVSLGGPAGMGQNRDEAEAVINKIVAESQVPV